MPLPVVLAGHAARCTARSSTTGNRCWNPAAFGMATCRYHGARRRDTVRKGEDHPQYKNGRETQQAKQQRRQALGRIALYEEVLAQAGALAGQRTRGPKPKERPAAKRDPSGQVSNATKLPVGESQSAAHTAGHPQGRKQMVARQDVPRPKQCTAENVEQRESCAPPSSRSCANWKA
jgi:hypothetical protein